MMPLRLLMVCAVVLVVCAGCGGGRGGDPAQPPGSERLDVRPVDNAPVSPNRHVWGIWDVTIDPATQSVEVTPLRSADMHLNVVRLLEITPCNDCLAFNNLQIVGPGELKIDVTLTHPYPGLLKYTGFDVRGIFMSQTDFTFPASGRKVAWGDGVPRMLDPDGYTPLFNPVEYPPTKPYALGYIAGKMATGGDLSATLNPFVLYRRDAPRRMFEAGGSETRTVRIYAPPGPIHFGYAIDACWQLGPHEIVDPLVDFPPDANCLEAYKINVDFPQGISSSGMSENAINVEVFDHQGIDTISSVTVEAPALFSGEVALALSTQTGEEGWLFTGDFVNQTGAGHGAYPLLVKVADTESDQNLGVIQAWAVGYARIEGGWAYTWGGTGDEDALSVAIDAFGNAYVTGYFWGTVDFDPGGGVDNHTSNGASDAFLTKFGSSGKFLWARTWGAAGYDWARSVAIDASGNAYMAGHFYDLVDLDPGTGVDNHWSNGGQDAVLSKFDPNGEFLWGRTWGGTDDDPAVSVALDASGNVYVSAAFKGTVDLDPGSGVDIHTSNGGEDAFLSKFDSNGDLFWAATWGGVGDDQARSVAIDASGNTYVTGEFCGTVDFDPGSGADDHTSNGTYDAFLSKFDSSGSLLWAPTWGGVSADRAWSVAVDGSGNALVAGNFSNTVDFDPGAGVDYHTQNGSADTFLSKFDPSGVFLWARTWDADYHGSVAIDALGNAYVTGGFEGAVDFDPGSGIDHHTPIGGHDAFLSKLDPTGEFLWARTWGGFTDDWAKSVATDASGSAYVGGDFYDMVDFDPGSGVDYHTSNGGNDAFLVKFLPDGNW